jgi:hypothetical protein
MRRLPAKPARVVPLKIRYKPGPVGDIPVGLWAMLDLERVSVVIAVELVQMEARFAAEGSRRAS